MAFFIIKSTVPSEKSMSIHQIFVILVLIQEQADIRGPDGAWIMEIAQLGGFLSLKKPTRALKATAPKAVLERRHLPMTQEPEIVNVLRQHPDGATVETLANSLGLVYDKEVRNRIDSARRGRVRYNIVRIAEMTFQLQTGVWPGRGR